MARRVLSGLKARHCADWLWPSSEATLDLLCTSRSTAPLAVNLASSRPSGLKASDFLKSELEDLIPSMLTRAETTHVKQFHSQIVAPSPAASSKLSCLQATPSKQFRTLSTATRETVPESNTCRHDERATANRLPLKLYAAVSTLSVPS